MNMDLLTAKLLYAMARPTYHASCEYIKGKWRWYVGSESGVVCTAASHTTLVYNLKRYMRRKGIATLSFRWDNDNRVEKVQV